jgi:ubiquinone/menaquinone biosynthesis C-methylase UbiE
MVEKLMTEDTLDKVGNNASVMVLTFNQKTGWIEQQYNTDINTEAYAKLRTEISKDKIYLWRIMEAYFDAFHRQRDSLVQASGARNVTDLKNSPELLNIKRVFTGDKYDDSQLAPFAAQLLPDKYSVEQCRANFYPPLLLLWLRYLDIYDRAVQGLTVSALLHRLQHPTVNKPPPRDEKEQLMQELGNQIAQSFGKREFWDNRYAGLSLASPPYEWYIAWPQIRELLVKHVPLFSATNQGSTPLRVIDLGCGNSTLAEQLWQEFGTTAPLREVFAIDFCDRVIQLMRARQSAQSREHVHYLIAEARDLTQFYVPEQFVAPPSGDSMEAKMEALKLSKNVARTEHVIGDLSGTFQLALDKGTFDCIVCSPEGVASIERYLKEVSRLLQAGGYFVLISCAINRDRISLLDAPNKYQWQVEHVIEQTVVQQPDPIAAVDPSANNKPVEKNIFTILLRKL